MKKTEYGHPRFHEILEKLRQLHNDKNHDYAGDGDALGNFHRVAEIMGMKPSGVAITYMMKQVDAVVDALKHDRVMKAEGLDGRLEDIAVYAVLTIILLEEERCIE